MIPPVAMPPSVHCLPCRKRAGARCRGVTC
jgi:hypothetical protein